MNFVGRVFSSVSEFYRDINPSTLTGAIDIIVVESKHKELTSSPFHIRFGKLKLFRPQDNTVDIHVNGKLIPDIKMKVGDAGEAFFVIETEEPVPYNLSTSPLTSAKPSSIPFSMIEPLSLSDKDDQTTNSYRQIQSLSISKSWEPSLHVSDSEYEDSKHGMLSRTAQTSDTLPMERISNAQSDSELDVSYQRSISQKSSSWSWGWGTLPTKDNYQTSPITCYQYVKSLVYYHNSKDQYFSLVNYIRSGNSLKEKITMSKCGREIIHSNSSSSQLDAIYTKYMTDNPESIFKSYSRMTDSSIKEDYIFHVLDCYMTLDMLLPFLCCLSYFGVNDMNISTDDEHSRSLIPLEPNASESISTAKKNYYKSLRLSHDQLSKLDLQYGMNTISFTVERAVCTSKIFLWKYDVKIVISDIDGTITKSDLFGHLFTLVGKDWTHPDVAHLYTKIKQNGYELLYLTSRALGQADTTRYYLKGIEQGKYQLPDGPVIMSPDHLFTAFHREVIIKRPEEFKIACLKDIKRLFEPDRDQPFHAGFGNRPTDAISYRKVGISDSRVFIIDPSGEIKLQIHHEYKSSYGQLTDVVDLIFAPVQSAIREDAFSDVVYWRKASSIHYSNPSLHREKSIKTTEYDTGSLSSLSSISPLLSSIPSKKTEQDEEDHLERLLNQDTLRLSQMLFETLSKKSSHKHESAATISFDRNQSPQSTICIDKRIEPTEQKNSRLSHEHSATDKHGIQGDEDDEDDEEGPEIPYI